ncbi:selenium-binding protein SBP56-related protein [Leucothrix pacifica]|uniref:Selenium-binding protein n=1 Tax=Leucothrix pacifica TaxID=1247513 RepID=A0A317CDN0_9GAMM|nr:selenium-binding protein SBP56-related protein [Leucothrix pacifica]PWQ96497.1 selenium-binding protein [Leucothrix pacifica]
MSYRKSSRLRRTSTLALAVSALLAFPTLPLQADETCMSPYMAKITGQEDFVYIWTLGVEGLGDGQDKLVTVDVNPKSDNYGKIINSLSVGGRNEAHHSGLTDDRKYLWAGGLDTNKIFIFDVHTDPAKPTLKNTIEDFTSATGGLVGPHTTYALPGRMMVTALSNNKDNGGRTGMAEYTNDGKYLATHWNPREGSLGSAVKTGEHADGYGYDLRALPRRNVMFTSSFTGWSNYMMDFGKMLGDGEAMKRFGNTMVRWDLHSRKPREIMDVPGAPLEIRCAWQPRNNWCVTTTALTSKIWLVHENTEGKWKAEPVADVGDPSKIPLPVDISLSADDQGLWVNTFMDGKTRYFDMSDPFNPKQTYEKKIGAQVNMASSSWDGKRVYYTSSLLANWDKKGDDNEQYFKAYNWDGKELVEQFSIDFTAEKLGRAHQMRFGAYSLYANASPVKKPATQLTQLLKK